MTPRRHAELVYKRAGKGARTAALACLSRLVHKAMSDHLAKPRRTTGQPANKLGKCP